MADYPTRAPRAKWPWWRIIVREVAWSADIEDGSGHGAPSQSKILAYVFAFRVGLMDVSWAQVVAMGLILAASYGRSMFKSALGASTSIFGKKNSANEVS